MRRKNVAVLLGKMSCPIGANALIAALNDPNRNVQQGAAWAVGNLKLSQAIPDLCKLLGDPRRSWYTKSLVVEALAKMRTQDAYEALAQFKHFIDTQEQTLESGGRTRELELLYDLVVKRHLASGEQPESFDDMRELMGVVLRQLKKAIEATIGR